MISRLTFDVARIRLCDSCCDVVGLEEDKRRNPLVRVDLEDLDQFDHTRFEALAATPIADMAQCEPLATNRDRSPRCA